jgi:hypothetical protein
LNVKERKEGRKEGRKDGRKEGEKEINKTAKIKWRRKLKERNDMSSYMYGMDDRKQGRVGDEDTKGFTFTEQLNKRRR